MRVVNRKGVGLFGAAAEHAAAMHEAGLDVAGTLDDPLGTIDCYQ